ncbi:MAG: hypothetical protein CMD88_03795 [Gammaproteobacteria bacterium]|nr:hypothetical protein [Gammaproteobacteria bacterium]
MFVIKNIFRNIIIGALILIPIVIFHHFTYQYFSNYSLVPSIVYLFGEMGTLGPIYLILIFYICGVLARFFSQNLTFNNLQ